MTIFIGFSDATLNQPLDPAYTLDVDFIIGKLKRKSAVGPNMISNKVLQVLPMKGLMAIANIANVIFHPNAKAKVIIMSKYNKNRLFTQNYRPVSDPTKV